VGVRVGVREGRGVIVGEGVRVGKRVFVGVSVRVGRRVLVEEAAIQRFVAERRAPGEPGDEAAR